MWGAPLDLGPLGLMTTHRTSSGYTSRSTRKEKQNNVCKFINMYLYLRVDASSHTMISAITYNTRNPGKQILYRKNEENVLFNDTHNTF